MLQQPSRRAYQDVHARNTGFFFGNIFAANDKAGAEAVRATHLPAEETRIRTHRTTPHTKIKQQFQSCNARASKQHLPQHVEYLQRQLARGRYDQPAQPVRRAPARAVQALEKGDEKGEGFAGAWGRGGVGGGGGEGGGGKVLPVFALPITSLPTRAWGNVARCTSVIVMNLAFFNAL